MSVKKLSFLDGLLCSLKTIRHSENMLHVIHGNLVLPIARLFLPQLGQTLVQGWYLLKNL